MIMATAKSTKTSGVFTAEVNGANVLVNAARDLTVAVNDVVLIDKVGAQWWAFGRSEAAAPAPPANNEAGPPASITTGQMIIAPVETRSYRTSFRIGWRTEDDDVYQGQYGAGNHIGAVFYGTKPQALAGATITGATFQVRMKQIGSYPPQAATMYLMTQSTRPSGAPTITSSTTGPQLTQGSTFPNFAIPVSWTQAMVNGTAGGIAFYVASGSPYLRMAGRGSWSAAFTLTINWRRP